jgi:DNA-binding transcriptional regulator YiaG
MISKEAFEAKIDRNGPVPAHCPELGPCHLWTGSRDKDGYGTVWFRREGKKAHRVAFFLAYARWPEPCACHHCDNTSCVNTEHLFEGTHLDNVADATQKGRRARLADEDHGMHRLSNEQISAMRSKYSAEVISQKELARQFGCSQGHVSDILNGNKRCAGHSGRELPNRRPRGEYHWSRASPSSVRRGERHGGAKLTEQQVNDIRANFALCRVTKAELARRFGISKTHVGRIIDGQSRRSA